VSIGKLELTGPFRDLIPRELEDNFIDLLPTSFELLAKVIALPFHYRDPFDRLFTAHALVEEVPWTYPDLIFGSCAVRRIW